jgi:DNA modification methylase
MLLNGDCLELMPTLGDKSVDMVLVDLPYGSIGCKWDIVIDLDAMWVQLKRICKPNANIVFFCTTKFGNKLINSNEKWFRYDLVWEKTKSLGFLQAKVRPLRQHEMVYVFGNPSGGKKTYNPQKTTGHKINPPSKGGGVCELYANEGRKWGCMRTAGGIPDDTRFPTSIQKFSNDKQKLHPTQKPVEACEWLIKTYSNEGETVLDFTMGSGSTGVACQNTGREFIGIEMDEKIFKIAEERLNEKIEH